MDDKQIYKRSRMVYRFLIVLCALVVVASIIAIYFYADVDGNKAVSTDKEGYTSLPEDSDDPNKIVGGVHVRTGLIEAEGLMAVVNNCTNCHSAELIIQNRMDKERWISTIRWMQKTQNLWDLGANEAVIVDYLVTNYPPVKKGRRAPLPNIEWYELKD